MTNSKIQQKVTRKSKKNVKLQQQEQSVSQIVTCVHDELQCWHCVPFGVRESSSLISIIQIKWECTRRRLLLRLLVGTDMLYWYMEKYTCKLHNFVLKKKTTQYISCFINIYIHKVRYLKFKNIELDFDELNLTYELGDWFIIFFILLRSPLKSLEVGWS